MYDTLSNSIGDEDEKKISDQFFSFNKHSKYIKNYSVNKTRILFLETLNNIFIFSNILFKIIKNRGIKQETSKKVDF